MAAVSETKMAEIYIRPTRASKPPVFCMLERGGIITGTVLLSCQHLPSDIKVSLNLPTLSHLPHTQDTVYSFYMSNVIYIDFLPLFALLIEVTVAVSSHVLSTPLLPFPHLVEGGMEH